MEERFTKLNDFYGPAAGTARRPFTTAPAAVGDRRMQPGYLVVFHYAVIDSVPRCSVL